MEWTLLFFLKFYPTDELKQLNFTDMPALTVDTKWRYFKAAIAQSFIVNYKPTMFPEQYFNALPGTAQKDKHISTSKIVLQFATNDTGKSVKTFATINVIRIYKIFFSYRDHDPFYLPSNALI